MEARRDAPVILALPVRQLPVLYPRLVPMATRSLESRVTSVGIVLGPHHKRVHASKTAKKIYNIEILWLENICSKL